MMSLSELGRPVVYVATDAELRNEHYYRRLWMAMRSREIPRRDWLDELANTFRDAEAEFCYRSGKPYELPDIDDIFDDPDMRWISAFLQPGADGEMPASRSTKLERLRVLDLYFRVRYPLIARHFGV